MKQFPIVDLFAGPGGLGEGFSSYQSKKRNKPFNLILSVEKERQAHKTLELRAFFRHCKGRAIDDYFEYLNNPTAEKRDQLFANNSTVA